MHFICGVVITFQLGQLTYNNDMVYVICYLTKTRCNIGIFTYILKNKQSYAKFSEYELYQFIRRYNIQYKRQRNLNTTKMQHTNDNKWITKNKSYNLDPKAEAVRIGM